VAAALLSCPDRLAPNRAVKEGGGRGLERSAVGLRLTGPLIGSHFEGNFYLLEGSEDAEFHVKDEDQRSYLTRIFIFSTHQQILDLLR
jgi:hypothetical protein